MVALAALGTSTPTPQAEAASSDSPVGATQAAVTAAATSVTDVFYDLVRGIAVAASVVALPLWWIGFPVTFPFGYLMSLAAPKTFTGGLFEYMNGILSLGLIFAAPATVVGYLFPVRLTSTASATASTLATAPVGNSRTMLGTPVLRYNGSPNKAVNPAAAKSQRSVKSAAAAEKRSKSASAVSKRRSAN